MTIRVTADLKRAQQGKGSAEQVAVKFRSEDSAGFMARMDTEVRILPPQPTSAARAKYKSQRGVGVCSNWSRDLMSEDNDAVGTAYSSSSPFLARKAQSEGTQRVVKSPSKLS